MNVGLIGVPQVGKSTLFRLLTGVDPKVSKKQIHIGVADVPDPRIDYLTSVFSPRKTTYARLNVIDTPGMQSNNKVELLTEVQDVDALVVVARVFGWGTETAVAASEQPLHQIQAVASELLLRDWAMVDTRLERLQKGMRQARHANLEATLHKISDYLADDVPLRQQPLSAEELKAVADMMFLTAKPLLAVVNVDEEQLSAATYPGQEELEAWCKKQQAPVLTVCAQLEMEIDQLAPADKNLFLQDLGISESGLAYLARVAYEHLDLISFFTAGEGEVRAWTIRKDLTAQEAAGKIHSDIARGFIRADVVSYEAFKEHDGQQLRQNDLRRLEGRDYPVADGDIIEFRFHV